MARILIVDQCSGSKNAPDSAYELSQSETGAISPEDAIQKYDTVGVAAGDLYTGRQQEHISTAINVLSEKGHSVERVFISAGFGLVNSDEEIPPYEATFKNMDAEEKLERRKRFSIRKKLEKQISNGEYDLVFFTLGAEYYDSFNVQGLCDSDNDGESDTEPLYILFNNEEVASQTEPAHAVSARMDRAKEFESMIIGLKGVLMKNFAKNIPQNDVDREYTATEVESWMTAQPEKTTQNKLSKF